MKAMNEQACETIALVLPVLFLALAFEQSGFREMAKPGGWIQWFAFAYLVLLFSAEVLAVNGVQQGGLHGVAAVLAWDGFWAALIFTFLAAVGSVAGPNSWLHKPAAKPALLTRLIRHLPHRRPRAARRGPDAPSPPSTTPYPPTPPHDHDQDEPATTDPDPTELASTPPAPPPDAATDTPP